MLKWILSILLVISISLNIGLFVSGIRIESHQSQTVHNVNMNQNANLNINGEKILSGKIVQETALLKDTDELTNFMKTMDAWSFINAKVTPLQKSGFLVYYPVAGAAVRTNNAHFTNSSTNTLKIGLK